jgi:DNA processing protein
MVPNIGAVHARILLDHFDTASAIFKARRGSLSRIEGVGEVRANNILRFKDFERAEKEISFIDKFKILPLFITDEAYPKRFLNCYDPPTMFYYRGNTDLNSSKMLAIVGTRTNTDYGKEITEQLVRELALFNIVIVSGLAFGIDAIAHKAALKYNLPTIGVVGHGLDSIYPVQHKALARDMLTHGGILTEFKSGTKPDKHNFPIRNRIVAGISDAVVLVETGIKGGSIITAEMANGYNRDVFAFPGRTIDSKSAGCNYLIKNNKAILLTDTEQLLDTMGWNDTKKKTIKLQRELFLNLTTDEKVIFELLQSKESLTIDEINFQSQLSSSAVASALLNLEFQGVVVALPGKKYRALS